ncbi:MAG TPA: DNA primase small subunit domain-containing protein, partial [Acidimicrobiales bacterium]|nr:DNA primase small subunit domain-containing protein [Acidimicrobiales bacterium]
RPSWALFDLDPGTTTDWDDLLVLARLHRTALEHLGVSAVPKVSGRRGIQIWVPVGGHLSFDETRTWVEKVSRAIGQTVPDLVSWAWQKNERGGLARLDYTQNAVNKTLVAPFSTRPSAGAPVSVPITWDELDDPELRPDRWTIRTVHARLAEAGDPLRPLIGLEQPLPAL